MKYLYPTALVHSCRNSASGLAAAGGFLMSVGRSVLLRDDRRSVGRRPRFLALCMTVRGLSNFDTQMC